jgi:hypothetical protein
MYSNSETPVWVAFIQSDDDPARGNYLAQSPNWNYVHGRAVLAKSHNPDKRVVFEKSPFLVSQSAHIQLDKASIELLVLPGFFTPLPPLVDDF